MNSFFILICYSFIHIHHLKPTFKNTLNDSLEEYIVSGHIPKPEFTIIYHIECNETTTLQQKFSILDSISNYHW